MRHSIEYVTVNTSYGQYCPLALAAEILCRRWTLLIVSRLIDGCNSFSSIHRGVPRISPSLLSKRLQELEQAGLLERRNTKVLIRGEKTRQPTMSYHLTESGIALEPIVMDLAVWGQHWGRDMEWEDLDPGFLAWSMHLRMDTTAMPVGNVVLEFALSTPDKPLERFWLLKSDQRGIEMCMKDPGLEPTLLVNADLRLFIEAWRGIRDLKAEIQTGHIQLHGPAKLTRQFHRWLQLSALAKHPRKRPGRETGR